MLNRLQIVLQNTRLFLFQTVLSRFNGGLTSFKGSYRACGVLKCLPSLETAASLASEAPLFSRNGAASC